MNKGTIYVLCTACLLVSIAFVEGTYPICESCEKKKQPHIEVSQPTGMIQQIRTSVVAGISATATTTTLYQPNDTASEGEV